MHTWPGTTSPANSPSLRAHTMTEAKGWLAKLNAAGTALIYSAHLTVPGKIFVDAGGNTYFAGSTSSLDFPTTPGALQKVFAGGHPIDEDGYDSDAFVTKLNAAATALIILLTSAAREMTELRASGWTPQGSSTWQARPTRPTFP